MPGRRRAGGRRRSRRLSRVDVEVQRRRGVHELEVGQRRRALLPAPRVERRPGRAVGPVVLARGTPPTRSGRRRVARRTPAAMSRRRGSRAGCTTRSARTARPAVISAGNETTLSSTITSGRCAGDDLAQLRLAVAGAVDQRLPRRLHERRELLDRRLAELRRRLADEVVPELSGRLPRPRVRVGRGAGRPGPRRSRAAASRPAHDASAANTTRWPLSQQHLAEADALVGRSVGRLGHEQDGQATADVRAHARTLSAYRTRRVCPVRTLARDDRLPGRTPDRPVATRRCCSRSTTSAPTDCRKAIAPFAELERSPEHIHTYRLTPLGLWNARAAGHDAEQVVDTLLEYSRYAVPHALLVDVAETMARYGRLRLEKHPVHGLVLASQRPAGARGGAAGEEGRRDARHPHRRRHGRRPPVRARQPQAGAAQARLAGRGLRRLRRRRGPRDRARRDRVVAAHVPEGGRRVVLARRLRRRRPPLRRRQDAGRRGRDGRTPRRPR